jgi:hypothetical protein
MLFRTGERRSFWQFASKKFIQAVRRPAGFADYKQTDNQNPGVIITSLIPFSGQNIDFTADVNTNGSVKVSILNNNGDIIAEADPIQKTVYDGRLKFNKKTDPAKIRLRFEFEDAKLYSSRFVN